MEGVLKILQSKAYWELKNHWASKLLPEFLYRARNNGHIEFTYQEAYQRFGIPKYSFTRAIDQLVNHGLIDIVSSKAGRRKNKSMYVISERWKQYGTPGFIEKSRHKRQSWMVMEGGK